MKRKAGLLAALGILALAFCAVGYGRAQPTQRTLLQTRIAMVNISQVIKNYRKFQSYEQEMKQQSAGVQQAVDARKAQAIQEQKEMENAATSAERREQLERHIKQLQRETQDLVDDAKQKMSRHEMDEFVQIYKEIKDAVDVYARTYALELVLQYSEAVGPEQYMPAFFAQKLTNRACMPLYIAPGMDITENVTSMLNNKLASTAGQAPRGG